MKLSRQTTTDANPDLRGRKHYFLIENAPATTLEAMDQILELAGWKNDDCPCYDDGFGCGYWIDIFEVDCFKAAYKAAKAGVKGYMAIEAARAEEAAAARRAEEEAREAAINDPRTDDEGNDPREWSGHSIEADHVEALVMDIERTLNAVDEARAEIDAGRVQDVDVAHSEALAVEAEHTAAALRVDGLEITAQQFDRLAAKYRAGQPTPAADLSAYPITTLHTAIDAEDGKSYAEKRVTRAYIARSITRALDSQQRHAEKYTAQDVIWLAEHNADHAYRNSVITGEEFTEIYHAIRQENARPLAILAAIRDALLTGAPVMPAARAA